MFEVRFSTTTYAPPHSVTILSPVNGWRGIAGVYAEGSWTFSLDETQGWDQPTHFKFVLDDRYWMDDPYIRITPTAGSTFNFDESGVMFSMSVTPSTPPAVPTPVGMQPPMPTQSPPPSALPPPTTISLPPISEGAIINRVVLIVTPFLTIGAAWLAGLVGRHVPGVTLDQTQIVSFMIAIVVLCLSGLWKWLSGWQQHELLVAQRLAAPLKPVIGVLPPVTTQQQ
jgi:hypothetical protein